VRNISCLQGGLPVRAASIVHSEQVISTLH
jgi:hypothetical protein